MNNPKAMGWMGSRNAQRRAARTTVVREQQLRASWRSVNHPNSVVLDGPRWPASNRLRFSQPAVCTAAVVACTGADEERCQSRYQVARMARQRAECGLQQAR